MKVAAWVSVAASTSRAEGGGIAGSYTSQGMNSASMELIGNPESQEDEGSIERRPR